MHSILITPKTVKKVITVLHYSKISGPGFITVVVLKNCKAGLPYTLANFSNIFFNESCFPDCFRLLIGSVVFLFNNVAERSVTE